MLSDGDPRPKMRAARHGSSLKAINEFAAATTPASLGLCHTIRPAHPNIVRSGFAALRARVRPRARSAAKREQVGNDFAKRIVWHHLW